MRKTLLFISIIFLSCNVGTANAQSVSNGYGSKTIVFNPNVKAPLNGAEKGMLTEVYGETLQKNVLDNPERLRSIKNILRNRVEILKMSHYPKDYKLLSQIPLFNKYNSSLKREVFSKSTFNSLKYNFDFYAKQTQVFRVDNTNYYIVIKSQHQN
ncbi:hypothetical protein MWU58_06095 [Flavobacteriaceae bacterium S0825]|uniref:hypothetical protein n=1 Tax=Gaetbulibacter sp. S0825 TaxID=2720084 RepID=UPI001431886C|nr:hypothetical protein [Gaetbulibacter sp. S0825]MCK0108856.1 hypothetical protein [Flavobacteriaceae bacterium S0825]NIX64492.1 hypothetical protein [Gaetbulibacter sp. S0825]